MTYQEAVKQRDQLSLACNTAAEKLEAFPFDPITGLTPDVVRATPEWITAKNGYSVAFNALREFNATFVKKYKKELREERRQRDAERQKKYVAAQTAQ